MICKNCAFENEECSEVCAECGASMSEDAVLNTEITEEAVEEAIAEEANEEVIEEAVEESAEEKIETAVPAAPIHEKKAAAAKAESAPVSNGKKKSRTLAIALIALAVVLVVMAVIMLGNFDKQYDLPVDRTGFDLTYIADGKLWVKPLSGEASVVSAELGATPDDTMAYDPAACVVQTLDGEALYFLESYSYMDDIGTLCVTFNGKDKIVISEGVASGFVVSKDGKTVLYITNIDPETTLGTLNMYNGTTRKISDGKARMYLFSCNDNGSYVAYTENTSLETYMGELWRMSANGDAVMIDDNSYRANRVFADGSLLYLKDVDMNGNGELHYYNNSTGESELVALGVYVNAVIPSSFSNKYAYVLGDAANPDKLDFIMRNTNGSESIILENVYNLLGYDVENENFLLISEGQGDDGFETVYASMVLKQAGKAPEILVENLNLDIQVTPGKASTDFSTIVYMSNINPETLAGSLMIRDGGKTDVIAENVSYYKASDDCKSVVYFIFDDSGMTSDMYVYRNGSSKKLSGDALMGTVMISADGEKVFYAAEYDTETYESTLYVCAAGGSETPVVIDTGVYPQFSVRSGSCVLYNKNFDTEGITNAADVYMWNGKESIEMGKGIELIMD